MPRICRLRLVAVQVEADLTLSLQVLFVILSLNIVFLASLCLLLNWLDWLLLQPLDKAWKNVRL